MKNPSTLIDFSPFLCQHAAVSDCVHPDLIMQLHKTSKETLFALHLNDDESISLQR